MSTRPITIAVLAASFLTGCPKSEELCLGPPVSPEAVIPYEELRFELCRYQERCLPESLGRFVDPTVEGCIAFEQCTGSPPSDWTVTPACLEALRTAPCDRLPDGGWPGYRVLSTLECTIGGPYELLEEGDPCGLTVDPECRPGGDVPRVYPRCGPGLRCDQRSDVCVPEVREGEPCSLSYRPGTRNDPCELDTFCDFIAGVCTGRREEGESCEILMDSRYTEDPCRSPARCASGVCVLERAPPRVYATAGESCDQTDDCLRGLACVDGACTPLVCGGGPGDPCRAGTCGDEGLLCHGEKNVCELRGPDCDLDDPTCDGDTVCLDDSITCQSR